MLIRLFDEGFTIPKEFLPYMNKSKKEMRKQFYRIKQLKIERYRNCLGLLFGTINVPGQRKTDTQYLVDGLYILSNRTKKRKYAKQALRRLCWLFSDIDYDLYFAACKWEREHEKLLDEYTQIKKEKNGNN